MKELRAKSCAETLLEDPRKAKPTNRFPAAGVNTKVFQNVSDLTLHQCHRPKSGVLKRNPDLPGLDKNAVSPKMNLRKLREL